MTNETTDSLSDFMGALGTAASFTTGLGALTGVAALGYELSLGNNPTGRDLSSKGEALASLFDDENEAGIGANGPSAASFAGVGFGGDVDSDVGEFSLFDDDPEDDPQDFGAVANFDLDSDPGGFGAVADFSGPANAGNQSSLGGDFDGGLGGAETDGPGEDGFFEDTSPAAGTDAAGGAEGSYGDMSGPGGIGYGEVRDADNEASGMEGMGGANGGDGSKIICLELYRQDLIPRCIFVADGAYGDRVHPDILAGYHLWATPIVRWMKRWQRFARFMAMVALPVATEFAKREREGDGSRMGRWLLSWGEPVCGFLGRARKILSGFHHRSNA